jgi:hypothetical protein
MEELLLRYRNILLRQYTRSHPKCYNVNRALKIQYQGTDKDWKCDSIHHKLRRPLSYSEMEELAKIANEIKQVDTENHYLRYYIKKL